MNRDPHDRLFSHNPLAQLAAAFAGGIVFASYFQINVTYLLASLAFATIVTFVGLYFARLSEAGFALLAAVFFTATCLTSLELRSSPNRLKDLIERRVVAPAESVELTGTVTGPVEFARDGLHLSITIDSLRTASQLMKCTGLVSLQAWFKNAADEKSYHQLDLQPGSRLSVRTKLDRTEQYRNPGVSTVAQYLDTRDIDTIAVLRTPNSIIRIDTPGSFNLGRLLYRWRAFLQQQINQNFSPETAGVLDAALLGNRHNLSHTTAERFREGGTFHVLVISGAHISFIGGLFLLLARRLTVRRWLQFGSATLMVWCYAVAVGADVSVVRAALMFSFLALGGLLYRRTAPLNSLGAAALVLLVWSPKDIFDPAFQLTFLSVLAILVLAWPILRNMSDIGKWRPSRLSPYPPACSVLRSFSEALYWSEKDWQRELHKLSHSYGLFKSPTALWLEKHHLQLGLRYTFAAIMVSVSVQVVLLPLQVVYFHRLSFSSLILTLVVGILLAGLAAVALIALIISQINSAVAEPFVKLADTIDWLMIHSVDPFAGFGIASMRVAEYSDWARIVYGLYYLPLLLMAVALARCKPLASPTTNTALKNRLLILLCVQLGMFLLLVVHPKSDRAYEGRLEVSFLDVGQGDSALVTMPDGTTLLIDGGGRPIFRGASNSSAGTVEREQRSIGERVVCEYLWSRGLHSIDYILATHADADHIDGLNDVIRNLRVRSALVGRQPENDAEYSKFAQSLNAAGVPIQIVQAGDVLYFGPVEAEVLWPLTETSFGSPSRNDESVVVRIKFGGRTFLLTGDIERSAEAALLSKSDQLRADVVKVAHHGSRTSSSETFILAAHPRVAVISVGRNSMFGHPHREVVERWQAIGAEVLTTGHSGTITVTTDGKDIAVTTFVQKTRQN
jgi:competence protein ComEC